MANISISNQQPDQRPHRLERIASRFNHPAVWLSAPAFVAVIVLFIYPFL